MIKRNVILVLILLGASLPARASSGTEAAAFLDIPVGATPASLGSAYTALATDAYAPVWNPAGLGFISGNEMAGQHLSYLESIHYEFLSFVHPLDDSHGSDIHKGIGVSAQYLGSGDIAGTDVNGNMTGNYSSHYGSYNVAYGQTLSEKVAVGVTAKWINAQIQDLTANAYGMDLGGLYKVTEKAQLAASLTNVGSKLKFIDEGDSLPTQFHFGGAYKVSSHFSTTAEAVYRAEGPASVRFGAQWRPMESVSLRAGYRTDNLAGLSPIAGLTVGMGLHVMGQELAYAWVPYGDLGNAQYFSLLARFGAREMERRNLIQYQNIRQHRTAQQNDKATEPEYQQLMQLLQDDDIHTAKRLSGETNQ